MSSPITDDMFSSSRTFATVMYTNHLKSIITFPFRGIGNFAFQVKQFNGRDKGYFSMASWQGGGSTCPPPPHNKKDRRKMEEARKSNKYDVKFYEKSLYFIEK